ncbi:MAG: sulfatase-like hydrolase/transferase [Phycisphaerales bacterium]|nr:sulfatase-like hydrolase/transferase [Phycisphaerales bacterium]
MQNKPNILYIMCDQFRYDCIASLGNSKISTPNIDRLVHRGVTFTNAYSPCPVCVPARYIVRTGRDPHTTCCFSNARPAALDGQPAGMEERCGPYLARFLSSQGYRTFGVGKFHTYPPKEELGYETHLHTEEVWGKPEHRLADAYGAFIAKHPAYSHIEQLQGERTEMYYMPQTSPFPADMTVEAFVASQVIELIKSPDPRPWFGFVSFIGPHPPFAPPIPFNRMYNPDRMDNPVSGDVATDHMDEHLPWMNRLIWADELNNFSARIAKSRYYGEISYIDGCIGKLLDAVEAMPDPDNVLICFFTDHGDHMGDHHSWQKESWFEQSAHIPFLVSWPARMKGGVRNGELVALTDLFAIASSAAGALDTRDGIDVLGMLAGTVEPRESLFTVYGEPGTPAFKFMVRKGDYKYIFFSNGGGRQLFNLRDDPNELNNLAETQPDVVKELHTLALSRANRPGLLAALEGGDFKTFPRTEYPRERINQMAYDLGVRDFSFLK